MRVQTRQAPRLPNYKWLCLGLGLMAAAGLLKGSLSAGLSHAWASGALANPAEENALLSPRLSESLPFAREESLALMAHVTLPGMPGLSSTQAYPYALPAGFHPNWKSVSLDQESLQLHLLETFPALERTTLGAEHFEYTAHLYRQLAQQIPHPETRQHLDQLAQLAEQMGAHLRAAQTQSFNGLPETTQVQARQSQLLRDITPLSAHRLQVLDVDESGQPVSQSQRVPGKFTPGPLMQAFHQELAALESVPQALQYPEALALVQHQGKELERLARNLELQWETVFARTPDGSLSGPVRVKLFAKLSLAPEQLHPMTTHAPLPILARRPHPVQ